MLPRRVALVMTMLAALLTGAAAAAAQDVEIPSQSGTTPAPPAAPAPPATPDPASSPPSAAPKAPVVLRIGSTGRLVKQLQAELRRRGLRVVVDGEFGPATKRAVKALQKRLKLQPTGVARRSLLARLGLRAAPSAAGGASLAPKVRPGASPYLGVFPVAGEHSYTSDFGDPRHQGSHEGVDIMAERGTPVLAVADVVVVRLSRASTSLGGVSLWAERGDGTQYFYAHLTSITAGLDVGSRAPLGAIIGTVGNTGDARYGAPHLHFEIHPGGGAATDPYPHLIAVDPTPPTPESATR